MKSGCAIYIFASNAVNFWPIFKIIFSAESLSQLLLSQKVGAQLRTLRTQFRRPCVRIEKTAFFIKTYSLSFQDLLTSQKTFYLFQKGKEKQV